MEHFSAFWHSEFLIVGVHCISARERRPGLFSESQAWVWKQNLWREGPKKQVCLCYWYYRTETTNLQNSIYDVLLNIAIFPGSKILIFVNPWHALCIRKSAFQWGNFARLPCICCFGWLPWRHAHQLHNVKRVYVKNTIGLQVEKHAKWKTASLQLCTFSGSLKG